MTSTRPIDDLLANTPFALPEAVLSFYKRSLVEACSRLNKRIDWSSDLLAEAGKVARSNNESALATARIAAETLSSLTKSTGQMYQSAFASGIELSRTLLAPQQGADRVQAGANAAPSLNSVFDPQSALAAWLKPSQNVAQIFLNSVSKLPQPYGAGTGTGTDEAVDADSPAKPRADVEPERALN